MVNCAVTFVCWSHSETIVKDSIASLASCAVTVIAVD